MDKNKINKIGLCFLIGLGLWGGGTFIKDFFINQPKLREKGKYTIGYIYKYRKRLKGADISYYKYNYLSALKLLELQKSSYVALSPSISFILYFQPI